MHQLLELLRREDASLSGELRLGHICEVALCFMDDNNSPEGEKHVMERHALAHGLDAAAIHEMARARAYAWRSCDCRRCCAGTLGGSASGGRVPSIPPSFMQHAVRACTVCVPSPPCSFFLCGFILARAAHTHAGLCLCLCR